MPNKPKPVEVTVDPKTTALLVLDLNARCENPAERCHQLIEPVARFLPRARQARLFIAYTAADRYQGTAEARIDRKSTRLNSSHIQKSRMPSSA